MTYERETNCLLRCLGVNNSYVGFRYTVYGIIRAVHEPELLNYISKGLYIETAAHFGTSASCVERDIRTVVNTVWIHGDRERLNHVFGFTLSKRPQNRAFIDTMAQYILNHYEEQI